ncbi:hypothetical protein A2U01_0029312 [Trifolium medium]|uniref:Transmembrane protein n=1 Tax=Trifolium medium TaxID=97028 RepID=A0A392PAD0_9FABA|nr:hypothetical protein [Trifolium medium]
MFCLLSLLHYHSSSSSTVQLSLFRSSHSAAVTSPSVIASCRHHSFYVSLQRCSAPLSPLQPSRRRGVFYVPPSSIIFSLKIFRLKFKTVIEDWLIEIVVCVSLAFVLVLGGDDGIWMVMTRRPEAKKTEKPGLLLLLFLCKVKTTAKWRRRTVSGEEGRGRVEDTQSKDYR